MEQEKQEQTTGIRPKANVQFTLHVHCADGTTKDIKCLGTVEFDPKKDQE